MVPTKDAVEKQQQLDTYCTKNNSHTVHAPPKKTNKIGKEKNMMSYQGQHQHKSHFHHWSPHSRCPRHRPSGLGYTGRWCTYTAH